MLTKFRVWAGGALVPLALVLSVHAQTEPPDFQPPADIAFRHVTIVSEGSRLGADVYAPKDSGDKRLPTIIMCHGWGGLAENMRPDAIAFARAGYLVVAFDYRGWGTSDGRVVLVNSDARGKPGETFTAEVKEIRGVVDPIDQTTDLQNVIHWVQGEDQCDQGRIGLWGSSYSGGHVVYAAAHDDRVKATVSQVPALDSRWVVAAPEARKYTLDEATKRARGELGYPPPGAQVIGNLKGAPILERMINYAPVELADQAPGCAMLFVVAEKEELFDNADHAVKAHAKATGPKKLVTIPNIAHYGIYQEARQEAQRLAIQWYDEHLKVGERQP